MINPNQINSGTHLYSLPNGMDVAFQSKEMVEHIYHEIFVDRVYASHGITINDGNCVFDVGANIGLFSLFAAQEARDVRLFCFEPVPPTFACLETNVKRHKLNAQCFAIGLSNQEQQAELTFYPGASGLSGRYPDTHMEQVMHEAVRKQVLASGVPPQHAERVIASVVQKQAFTCQLRPLSALIHEQGIERIDLLKIDVERSEADVLAGIADADWQRIGQIVIEVHTADLLASITPLLQHRGYHTHIEPVEDEIVNLYALPEQAQA